MGVERYHWSVCGSTVFLLMLLIGSSIGYAFNIPTGNRDLTWRWDNTVRYTLQTRVADQDDKILSNINADDGDRNFENGIVSNRLDILSEMDLVYKRSYGVRVSGAFWYDQRYSDDLDNDDIATSNYLEKGNQAIGLYDSIEDEFEGPDGEILDAFVFARLDADEIPIYLKVGRHTVFWGEALLNPFHGISYAQMPLDLGKATAQPGVEAKELFRPLSNISFVSPITTSLELAGQYFTEWGRCRVPESGTYFGSSDLTFFEYEGAMILAPGVFYTHGRDIKPKEYGDYGFSLKWAPADMTMGTFGFYYRRFSDKLPQAIINVADESYHFAYASDIDVYGLSYSHQVFGLSLASEISYRYNMPLVSEAAVVTSSADLPDEGDILGARGETLHALVNLIGLLKDNPLWDAGSWNMEFAYSRWLDVGQGENYFKGRDGYDGFDEVTKDNGVIAANFEPKWMQVFPGVDISMPITASIGLWGVSAVTNGGGKGDGSWGVGFTFDIFNRHTLKLNYVDFFGELETNPATGLPVARGGNTMLRDRDFIALTFKTSF